MTLALVGGTVVAVVRIVQQKQKEALWALRERQWAEHWKEVLPKVEHNLPDIWSALDNREIYIGDSIDRLLELDTPVLVQDLAQLRLYVFARDPSWAHSVMEKITVQTHDGEILGASVSSDCMYYQFFGDRKRLRRYGPKP